MENLSEYREIVDVIKEAGGDPVKRCFQCGLCDTVCPWNRVTQFSMRKIIREATFGMTEIENEDIWRCTTCGRCPQQCPRDVQQIQSGVALRRMATEFKVFPKHVQPIRSDQREPQQRGQPLEREARRPGQVDRGLGVKTFKEGMEYLYFPCCYLAYDPRLKKVAPGHGRTAQARPRSTSASWARARTAAARASARPATRNCSSGWRKENIKNFIDRGVKKILVSSPHCYHTFKNEYPEFMANFEVVNMSQFLARARGRRPARAQDRSTRRG